MKHKKSNLMNEASNSRFVTRKQNIINDQSNEKYDARNDIRYSIKVLKSNICDFNND